MGETLHIAYKRYKIKRKFTFLGVNTKNISSRELKTSKISLMLRTPENSNVFNTLDKLCLVFTVSVRSRSRNVFFSRKSDEYAITKSITTIPTFTTPKCMRPVCIPYNPIKA